ncbi:TetR family transcriptional regulator [Streptomyces sp. SID5785]|uniref:ScbR family autoregulator-binding transcription factor n=1 Tax=Streptomyces sp. SID5785 TaxID=2690309 RepID=UPI001360DF31|nr:TetR family transcriptional regulator [Streptomyces sp. SID5785]MZD09670.1 TetR family transcriptional regulator [Streptomyces sp. SID5785]
MTQQVRAARTRHALIHSAALSFEAHGYTGTRLTDISSGAGVSVGALHFHFDSKPAMSDAVQEAAHQHFRRAAQAAQHGQSSALQQLINSTHAIAGLLRADVVARAGLRLNRDGTLSNPVDFPSQWRAFVDRRFICAADQGALLAPQAHHTLARFVTAATMGLETLGRTDKSWLATHTITDLWAWLLPKVATTDTGLSPAGTDTSMPQVAPRTPPANTS